MLAAENSLERVFAGYIDVFGEAPAVAGWFFCGWIETRFVELAGKAQLSARFGTEELRGDSHIAFYEREGLGERGSGFVAYIENPLSPRASLTHLVFRLDRLEVVVTPSGSQGAVAGDDLPGDLLPLLVGARPDEAKNELQSLLLYCLGSRGILDLVAYDEELEGWLLLGWTSAAPMISRPQVS